MAKKHTFINLSIKILKFIAVIFIFVLTIKLLSTGINLLGEDSGKNLLRDTTNPVIGLFIGILATAVIQSSSTTTSMIVALVTEGLPISFAIPMIMGANIGTSVTSSIVAFGHLSKKKEYRRAVAAATVHDFFNILVVILIFPLEYFFGILSIPSIYIAEQLSFSGNISSFSLLDSTIKPVGKLITKYSDFFPSEQAHAVFILILSAILLVLSLKGLTYVFKGTVSSDLKNNSRVNLFKNSTTSLLWGFGLTALVQSSSVTSSLIVPLVAKKKTSLAKAFPFLMGANLGTTITAFLAALSASARFEIAITIALAHILFNLFGIFIFFPFKFMRNIPLLLAKKLGMLSYENRLVGIVYVSIAFFILPFAMYLVSK